MNKIQIIRNFITKLPMHQEFSFKFVRESLTTDDMSTDTIRKSLHRIHDQGLITIIKSGVFVKEDENFEVNLFVYGSLKKGFDNHGILSKATYISKARTVRKFAMYEAKNKEYPYLIKNQALNHIYGELFKIRRKDLLQKIDIFEGSPDYYTRDSININTRSGNKRAFTYFYVDTKNHNKSKAIDKWNMPEKFDIDTYFKSIMEDVND